MLVPVLWLLHGRYCNMMLVVFGDSTLAPALRGMLDERTSIVHFCDRKHWPLILPQNKGD